MAADTSTKKYDVFICHAKEDTKVATAMCAFLEEKKFSCWIASRDISPGKDYAASIIGAIPSSRIMVVVLSEGANHSNHVRIEVERAFKNDADILPFRIQDVQPEQALEYYLSAYQWLDALSASPETYFEVLAQNCATLVGRDLSAKIQNPEPEPQTPAWPAVEEPDALALPQAQTKAEEEKPAADEAPAMPSKPAAEEKTVVEPQRPVQLPPIIKEPPPVQQNTTPQPQPPVRPASAPPFIKPPARQAGSPVKALLFTAGGIVLLILLFFVYKSTLQKHAVWFRNYALTPVYIELDGNLTKIESGDSIEYWAKNKYHLQTKASTYVLRDDGGVLGQNLEWDVDTTINSWHNITYPLEVGPKFFLLKMINNSPEKLVSLKVTSEQASDYSYSSDVTIPNDGRTYNLGYYRTFTDLAVVAKNERQQGWEWDCGRDFKYPNLWDQWIRVKKN